MGAYFMSDNNNYGHLELIQGGCSREYHNVEDVLLSLKENRRNMLEKIEILEDNESFEAQREIAVLIRKVQYLDVLLDKNKSELERIFFPKDNGSCIVPDVFQWYQGPSS